MSAIQMAVQQAMQQGMAGGAGGAAGGPKVGGPGAGAKVDPGMIYMELGRCRKLLTTMFQKLNWELPPDILDDQMVAQSVAGQQPGSAPTNAAGGGAPPAGGATPGLPSMGGSAGISPIQAPGQTKTSGISEIFSGVGRPCPTNQAPTIDSMNTAIDAVAILSRSLNAKRVA
jgi:hypothetical protein